MKKNIKIYISCHKECFLPQRSFLYPIQVGAKNAPVRLPRMLHDDEGENISAKNPSYCELTAQYWAWKNEDADYYGFFHYRRYMNFGGKCLPHNSFQDAELPFLNEEALQLLSLDAETVEEVVSSYDMIATTQVSLKEFKPPVKSNYEQYAATPYQHKEDLDVLLEIVKERYPEYYRDAVDYLHSGFGYFCNMFIMKRELFQKYSAWLFDILEEHEKRRDYGNYDIMGCRVSGYLGERLFGIWFCHWKKQGALKCTELQRTLFANTDCPPMVEPAFDKNNISIALAANDYFIPYTAILLKSVIAHASTENNYDILLLTQDVKEKNKVRLDEMLEGHPNFQIRYVDPSYFMGGEYHFYVRGHFGLQTYYRLVLPQLLPAYDKILYLDSDMIVQADVAELYGTDVEGYLLAACRDPDTAGQYNGFQGYERDKKNYMDHLMKMREPFSYFQAGTLLLNLEEFRKTYTLKQVLDFAASQEWRLLDQDILNCLCQGKVKHVDMSWNVMVDLEGIRIGEIIGRAPRWMYQMYVEARKHPKIIHYAGFEKPWSYPEMDMGDIFWKYARETVFYEEILYRMTRNTVEKFDSERKKRKSIFSKIRIFLLPYESRRYVMIRKLYCKIFGK